MTRAIPLLLIGFLALFFTFCGKGISEGQAEYSTAQIHLQVKVTPQDGGKAVFVLTSKKGFKLLLNPAPKIKLGAAEFVMSGPALPGDVQYFKNGNPVVIPLNGANRRDFELHYIYCVEADLTCVPGKIKLRLSASGQVGLTAAQ